MKLFRTSHPVKVQEFLASNRIIIKDLVKFAEFKEENLIVIVLLNLPILRHSRCEILPMLGRHIKRSRVIIGIIKSSSFFVFNELFLNEVWSCF